MKSEKLKQAIDSEIERLQNQITTCREEIAELREMRKSGGTGNGTSKGKGKKKGPKVWTEAEKKAASEKAKAAHAKKKADQEAALKALGQTPTTAEVAEAVANGGAAGLSLKPKKGGKDKPVATEPEAALDETEFTLPEAETTEA